MAGAKKKQGEVRASRTPAGAPTEAPSAEAPAPELEAAIGRQVRQFRQERNFTLVALAQLAGLSRGMLSKIENGMTSPSLATLSALAQALNVPVTSLFRKYEEQRDATFVKANQGLVIERRGSQVQATSTSCSATRSASRSRSSPISSP